MLKIKKQPPSKDEQLKQQKEITANQWVPVLDIEGAITYKNDNHISGMLKIEPLNIDLFSDREKKNKVSSLTEELNGEIEGMQIFCIGRPVDLNEYIEWRQEKAKFEQNYMRKRVLNAFTREASNIASSGETIERRFYIIFSKKNELKTDEELKTKLRDYKNKLSSAELTSHICTDDEIIDLYSLFAHPVQASFERSKIVTEIPTILDV